MVTITQTREDNTTSRVIDLDTTENAEAFLDGLAGSYWGLPGMKAKREGLTLTISACVIGGQWATISTYLIEAAA